MFKVKRSRVVYFHSYKIRNLLTTYVNRFGTDFTSTNDIKYYRDFIVKKECLASLGDFRFRIYSWMNMNGMEVTRFNVVELNGMPRGDCVRSW